MNNTEVQVIDTLTNTNITSIEKALASSIRWGWMGGDSKDQLTIVGSYLKFTMIGLSCEDGQYYDLFTGDETRYKVIFTNTDTGDIYFQGHLLPDAYSEPYRDAPIPVDFMATDGLGRLKGKYLPEVFYGDEQSVIAIISECLKLTGLAINFRFAPAIENYLQKDYNKIYIDTADYKENKRKRDAYDILNELLGEEGLQSTIYQADNVFNIEGWNIRQLRVYTCKEYDINGNFLEEKEITRLSKKVTALATPSVTMQPPYGVINITHERKPVEFPETLSKEENDGWASFKSNIYEIYALDWFGNDDFHAYARQYVPGYYNIPENREDFLVYFGRLTGVGDEYINLRKQPYIRKNGKYKIDLNFSIITESEEVSDSTRQTFVDQGFWTNPFDYRISILHEEDGVQKEEILFSNFGVNTTGYKYREQNFNVEGEKENAFEFVANYSGVLKIQIWGVEDIQNQIFGVGITEAKIKHLDFVEEFVSTTILNEDYTNKKEIELAYADDSTAESKAFRLQKIRAKNNYNTLESTASRTREEDGYNLLYIDLKGANIVKENRQVDTEIEVFYNYLNSQEHVIKEPIGNTETPGRVYDFNSVIENRDYWEQWTDAVYKIERIRYGEAVRNLYNRMYDIPVPKLDMTVKNNVKFNDFINFPYKSKNSFIVTNCEVDIDKGLTNVTGIESYYAVATGSNIPPVVEAGNDIAIGDGVTEVTLSSEGYDPDGFIVSYTWTVLEGSGANIQNPNDNTTVVYSLTGDRYVFQVEVIDNQGATATDTVTVYRDQSHAFSFDIVAQGTTTTRWRLNVDPEIAEGAAINFKGSYELFKDIEPGSGRTGTAELTMWINSTVVIQEPPAYPPKNSNGYTIPGDFSFTYLKGDIIEVELEADCVSPDVCRVSYTVDAAEFVEGFGEVTGLPITISEVAP